jgi:hypothetical protein
MDRESLELLLGQGLSIEKIGERFRKHPSTVSYWMAKYGLQAVNREKYAAKGGVDRERREELVKSGASIAFMAENLHLSPGAIRHWLAKYGLETLPTEQLRKAKAARDAGRAFLQLDCRHHGLTDFWIEGRGSYRCLRCRQEAVARRRRTIKEILVGEAGGSCAICGYDRCIGALHFHHRDPFEKSFAISVARVARSLARARKCVLLCSNSHVEVENGVASLPVE